MDKKIKLTESNLHDIVKENVQRILTESYQTDNYTHFAVNKKTNLIVNGWDYSDIEPEDLKNNKYDYFLIDLEDNDFNPKDYKILTRKSCQKQGINPDDMNNCWSNNGEVPCSQELNEAWYDKFNFIGSKAKQGVTNTGKAIGKGVTNTGKAIGKAVNDKYQQAQKAVKNYKDNGNTYSQLKDNERQATKKQQIVNNMISELEKFINSGVLNDVSYGKKANISAQSLINALQKVARTGYGSQILTNQNNAANFKANSSPFKNNDAYKG
jgi:hypothetical protein